MNQLICQHLLSSNYFHILSFYVTLFIKVNKHLSLSDNLYFSGATENYHVPRVQDTILKELECNKVR